MPQASISNGTAPRRRHAVDEDQRVGRGVADRRGQLRDRVHDPGRCLVVGQQDRLVARRRSRPGPPGPPPGRPPSPTRRRRVVTFGAVGLGDLGEPVAERPDRDAEDAIARRQDVDDGRLEAAGARRTTGSRCRSSCRSTASSGRMTRPSSRRELGPAVVDHLAPAGLPDARRERGRSGDAQVRLEAGHGWPPRWHGRRVSGGPMVARRAVFAPLAGHDRAVDRCRPTAQDGAEDWPD